MAETSDRLWTTGEVATFVHDLSDAYLDCRDYGHTWRAFTARWDPEMNAYARVLQCARCTTEREQWLSATGSALRGGYHYPEGYQAPPGSGRMTGADRDALRLESVTRTISAAQERAATPAKRARSKAS